MAKSSSSDSEFGDHRHKLRRINVDPSKPLAELAGISEDGSKEGKPKARAKKRDDDDRVEKLAFGMLAEQDEAARPAIDRRHNPLAAPLFTVLAAALFLIGGGYLVARLWNAAEQARIQRDREMFQEETRPTRSVQ
jgi:hypothetical protein